MLVVHPSLPANSLAELIALAFAAYLVRDREARGRAVTISGAKAE